MKKITSLSGSHQDNEIDLVLKSLKSLSVDKGVLKVYPGLRRLQSTMDTLIDSPQKRQFALPALLTQLKLMLSVSAVRGPERTQLEGAIRPLELEINKDIVKKLKK